MAETRTSRESNAARAVRRLAAYLPSTLAARILQDGLPPVGKGEWMTAAALFCDLSGFATMASALAAAGPEGAEQLNQVLLMTFTAMINTIHKARGAVSHFHGDAMMVYFPDDDGFAATRALACAQFMQSLIQTGYSQVVTSQTGKEHTFSLSMKIGVGYGVCLEVVVGDPQRSLEFVVAGPAVTEAVAAQERAEAGQVIASQQVLVQHGLAATEPFSLFRQVLPVPDALPLLNWALYDMEQLQRLAATAVAFVHPALYERIMTEESNLVAEHRPVTSMFVRFDGIDFLAEDAGEKLQFYYNWAGNIVTRYGGANSRLNRLLTGDKGDQLHIIFGAPVAPDAPAQALRCALALQREKPDFVESQQIGVVSGQVFACAVGSPSRREYTTVGDQVILSSRLTYICPPDAILIDEGTALRCNDQFDLTDMTARDFKGFAASVTYYRVQGERQMQSRIQSRYGVDTGPVWVVRQLELGEMQDRLQLALLGQGQILALSGPAGSGRTRLLAAGVQRWLEARGWVLVGMGQQHLSDVPYSAWLPVWRDFFGLQPEMDAAVQIERIVRRVEELFPQGMPYVSLWLERMNLPVPTAHMLPAGMTGEARQAHLFTLVNACFSRAAQQRPLLLVVEDVHWADGLSLALLQYLSGVWHQLPVCIAMTLTPAADEIVINGRMDQTTIHLAELTAAAGRQLVARLVDEADLPANLINHLGLADAEARVLPFFLEESVTMLRQMGLLRREGGRLVFDDDGLRRGQIPTTIHNLLLARLDQVSASARALLQTAAVSGRQFEKELLYDLLPTMSRAAVDGALAELEQAHIIHQVHSGPDPAYLFQNDMMRDVAYQSLPYARRQLLHESIAAWLVDNHQYNLRSYYAVLAYHYGFTNQHAAGLQYALVAGDEARAAFASQAALDMYNQALRHLQAYEPPNRWQTEVYIYLARADVQQLLGAYEAAAADAEKVIELAGKQAHQSSLIRAQNTLAAIALRREPGERVLTLVDAIIERPADQVTAPELGYAWLTRAEAFAYLGELDQTRAALQVAERLFQEAQHRRGLMRVQLVWGQDYYNALGQWEKARGHFESALHLMAGHPENYPEERIRFYLGLAEVACHTQALEQAADFLRKAEGLFTGRSYHWWRAAFHYWQGHTLLAHGDPAAARTQWRLGLKAINSGASPDLRPLILLALADITVDPAARQNLLSECVTAAQARARLRDQVRCLRAVAEADLQ